MTASSPSRRSLILRAAARLFEHYGHGKTTMQDVAREAQIGVGTLYLEFSSKEAIVQELSQSSHAAVINAMREATKTSDDWSGRLLAVMRARTAAFLRLRERGQHACELVHCTTDGVKVMSQRFRDEEVALLADVVRGGQGAGRFIEALDARDVAALIQRSFVSLSPPFVFGAEDDLMAITERMCSLILHGIVDRPSTWGVALSKK